MDAKNFARVHAIVEGHVQGVGFRYFVQESATAFGLSGWVRNLWDGTVELVAEGERDALDRLLSVLRRGPRGSTVAGVNFEWGDPTGEFKGFQVRQTSG